MEICIKRVGFDWISVHYDQVKLRCARPALQTKEELEKNSQLQNNQHIKKLSYWINMSNHDFVKTYNFVVVDDFCSDVDIRFD